MTEQELLDQLKVISEETGYKLNVSIAERIARFKARTKQDLSICACDPNNPYRGCVGSACVKELKKKGVCHCNLFSTK